MANLSKIKRDNMIAFLEQLKLEHTDDESIRAFNEIENHLREKKYGIVWEEHSEEVDELLRENIPVLTADPERRLCKDENLPWNFIIQGDNLQALYLLEKTHKGKVDCIYIDPPYNTGATDWKYNNNYVGKDDAYRHSKWLSMMKNRLILAKHLLNPKDSVLIVTIDENEYHHLRCLLDEIFPEAKIQMISSIINPKGAPGAKNFFRVDEYIFFVQIGEALPQKLSLSDDFRMNASDKRVNKLIRWQGLAKTQYTREHAPGCFYPIYLNEDMTRIVEIGDPIGRGVDRNSIPPKEGCVTVWPLNKASGAEAQWSISAAKLRNNLEKGYVRVAKGGTGGIYYLTAGVIKQIEDGEYEIIGRDTDGSIIIDESNYEYKFVPGTVWKVTSHDATRYGSDLLTKLIPDRTFPFPKSLYAVRDAIRFFIADKRDALVVDFFAGSGTTMHAVNLLNAEDGGNRTCIMVTNNEISIDDEKKFAIDNYGKEDLVVWDKKPTQKYASYRINYNSNEFIDFRNYYGIAKYVTWPRTVCSINGVDVNNNVLKGNYLETDIPMADGFKANVKFFKCDWTPRKPDDYLLSNALCLHICEMIELQNAIEIDNVKNVLILNKSDFKKIIMNPEIYSQIKNIWVNQNIILNAEELKLLEGKGYKYIPREFFGQELKEAAE